MEYENDMAKSSHLRLPYVIGLPERSGERAGYGGPKTLYTADFPDMQDCELSEDDLKELAKYTRDPRDSTKAIIAERVAEMQKAKYKR